MAVYQIFAKQTTYYLAEVEAENFDIAREMAESVDYDDYKELPEIEWEVVDISNTEDE